MTDEWKSRLNDERIELSNRLGKLNIFLANLDDDDKGIQPFDIGLLIAQSRIMTAYLEILERRIERTARHGAIEK